MELQPPYSTSSLATVGFSLTELLVCLAIFAIMSLLALPSLAELFARQQAESFIQQFRQQLSYARVQAVSLGSVVTVCPRQLQQCDGRWSETPVQIFDASPGNAVLKQIDALKPDHRLFYNRELLEFRADGSLNALQNGTFIYCVAQYRWHASLSVSQSGRSQLQWHEQPCPY
jgi:type IV fimbrial biogenesis protein FimT